MYGDDPRAKFIVLPALDENEESNFSYKYGVGFDTAYFLDMRESLDDVSFRALYMNQPIEREGLLYSADDLRRYYELPGEPEIVLGVCDTAEGGGDDTFLPVAYGYGDDWYIEDCVCDPGLPEFTDSLCVNVLLKHKVKQCQFESNAAGGRTADKVQKGVKEKNGITHITKKRTTSNKITKIIVNSSWVKEHCLFKDSSCYSKGSTYAKMMNKLCSYTFTGKSKHDDVPDGMAQLAEYIQGLTGSRAVVFKRPF
jgi:predicted phage terminase large subunit-like protein